MTRCKHCNKITDTILYAFGDGIFCSYACMVKYRDNIKEYVRCSNPTCNTPLHRKPVEGGHGNYCNVLCLYEHERLLKEDSARQLEMFSDEDLDRCDCEKCTDPLRRW